MYGRKQTDSIFGKFGCVDSVIVSTREVVKVPGTLEGVMAKHGVDALTSGQPLPENNKAILLPHLIF